MEWDIYRYRVIEAETGLDKKNVPPWRPHAERSSVCLNRLDEGAISGSRFVPSRINQIEIQHRLSVKYNAITKCC